MNSHRFPNTLLRAGLVLMGCAVLNACTTGPDYARPAMHVPGAYKSPGGETATAPAVPRDWWTLFEDAELNALVDEALGANEELNAAMARVEQSRAASASAKSAFYPTISMSPSATRSGTAPAEGDASQSGLEEATSTLSRVSSLLGQLQGSSDGTSTGAGSSTTQSSTSAGAGVESTSSRYRMPFDLSYEIDLWGKAKRSYESAQAQAVSSQAALESVRQMIAADLVKNYFNLRALDARQEILTKNLDLYEEQQTLTRQKEALGLSSPTDALQAEIQLESARAEAADTGRQRADLEHAIAILLGRSPSGLTLAARPLTAALPEVPAGLPSDLLRQRPDVAEAEQDLVAANAEIGVAQAELYPSISLTGSAGFESGGISELLDWQSRFWSFGPSVNLPIFNGGRLKAQVEQAKARHDELAANYRSTVLTAFQEVEDSLNDLGGRAAQAEAQAKARAAAAEYLRLTQIEYDTGGVDYLQVINAEQSVLNNELTEVDILKERMVSTVLLMKALGGGWDAGMINAKGDGDSLAAR